MARLVTIQVEGADQNYQAMVTRITQSNARMTRDAVAGAQQTAGAVRAWETSLSGIPGILRTIGSGFLALQAINFVKTFTGFAEVLHDTSNRTQILVEDLHALERIGKLEGVTFEQMTTSMKFLSKAIAESADPASDAAKIFGILNINAQGIIKTGGNTKDVMLALADAFKKTLSPTDQVLVAQKLMSRGGESMIGVLKLGTTALKDQMEEQVRHGVITTDSAKKAADMRDKWGELVSILQAKVGGPVIDFLENAIRLLQTASPLTLALRDAVVSVAGALDTAHAAMERWGSAVNRFAKNNFDARNSVAELTKQLEALQRNAPGDIGSQQRVQREIDAARVREAERFKVKGSLGSLGGNLDQQLDVAQPGTNQSSVAAQLAAMEKKGAAANKALADAKRLAEEEERIRQRSIEQLAKVQGEILKLEQSNASLGKSQDAANEAQRAAALALIEHEKAATITAAKHDKTLTPALNTAIGKLAELKIAALDAADALKKQKDAAFLDSKAADLEAMTRQEQIEIDEGRIKNNAQIKKDATDLLEIQRATVDVQADQLAAMGQTVAADRLRLENQIKYLEALRKEEEIRGNIDKANLHGEQIRLAQQQITGLGEVSINVGQTIANSVGDAFEGVILGIGKLSDVGKNLFNALVRDVAQFFTSVMTKKLGFENLIFTNLRGFGGQAQNALDSGMPGGGGGGGGGFLDSIMGMFGGGGGQGGGGGGGFGGMLSNIFGSFGRPSGVSGPLMENGAFLSSGGGTSGWGGMLGQVGGGISSLFGTSGGGTGLGSIGTFFSDIGSGSSALGSFGGPILGGAAALITAGFTGGFKKSKLGSTIGSTVGGAIGSIWGPIGTFVGATIGNLIGSLFNQTPNPTAILKAKFDGIFFDAIEGAFRPGGVQVGVLRTADIGKGRAEGIRTQVQGVLQTASQQWTDILNAFSPGAKNAIIPTLEGTNANLNNAFARLKFSEGGKRSIDQELADFAGKESGKGFFHAIRASLGAGFQAELSGVGLTQSAELARDQFQRGALLRGDKATGGVFNFPTDEETAKKFIAALGEAAKITSSLATFSKGGIAPFTTGTDVQFLEHMFGGVFGGGSDPKDFIKNVEGLREKIAPVVDYLKKSVAESTELFATGMVAALNAATESDAMEGFQKIIGEGTKKVLQAGLTEAMLSGGQFNDLLAPIQQTLRDFTQQAIVAGAHPDIPSMRAALEPQIQAVLNRAKQFAPFAAELQRTGAEFNRALGIPDPEEIAKKEEAARQAAELASQSASLFGNGLITALQSATQSDAKRAFMQTLGEGTREVVFKGITDAFIASAQFSDLLKPIQDTISSFTEQAVETGQLPDMGALLGELSPQIQALKARGEFLGPLLAEIQKLGLNLNDLFASFAGKQAPRGPTNIKIDINGFNKDVKELANELDDHLRGLLGAN
jgi:hypothetical protein